MSPSAAGACRSPSGDLQLPGESMESRYRGSQSDWPALFLGKPELRMPSAVPVSARFRVAPLPAFSCSAPDVGLGFPLVLHLRLYRRWITELPRCAHLSAVPSCQSSSYPEHQPFGIADDSSSELPRTSNPPAPIDGYPSYPGSHTYRFALF